MEIETLLDMLDTGLFTSFLSKVLLISILILIIACTYYLIHIGNRHVEASKRLVFKPDHLKAIFLLLLGFTMLFWLYLRRGAILPMLTPFIISAVIAYAFSPVIEWIMKTTRLPRVWSVLVLFLSGIFLIVFLFYTLVPSIAEELRRLGEQLPEFSMALYHGFEGWYQQTLSGVEFLPEHPQEILEFFNLDFSTITNFLFNSLGNLATQVGSIISSLVYIVTIPVLTFYFMKDERKIADLIKESVPVFSQKWVFPLANQVDRVLSGFIRGQLLVALFVGVASGLALIILGVEFAILIGIIAGITNIIPYLGPILGGIPAAIIAFLDTPIKALWVIIAFVIIQQTESSVVSPRIVGQRVGLHPTVIILALLVGGSLWGFLGLLIAVPLAAILNVLISAALRWIRHNIPEMF
ncbi:MAG: AI-2E family transporter [Tindallia sp. MSAO_Bac2]|nr:MAG: AI-2E family transporter [Tindallia sp. MSAO_Bac2]